MANPLGQAMAARLDLRLIALRLETPGMRLVWHMEEQLVKTLQVCAIIISILRIYVTPLVIRYAHFIVWVKMSSWRMGGQRGSMSKQI